MKFTLWVVARAGFVLTLIIWVAGSGEPVDSIVILGDYALHVDAFAGDLTIAWLPSFAPVAPESVSGMVSWFKAIKTPVATTPVATLWFDDMPLIMVAADLWVLHLVFLCATIVSWRWSNTTRLTDDQDSAPRFRNRWLILRIASPLILGALIMLITWGQEPVVILQALLWPFMLVHFAALYGFPRISVLDTISFVFLIPVVFAVAGMGGQNGREFYVRIGVAVEAFLAYALISYWGMRRTQTSA